MYLKKKKLYEVTKELLKEKTMPLLKQCDYRSYKGCEWLEFYGVNDDYSRYKVTSQKMGNWINIERFSNGKVVEDCIYVKTDDAKDYECKSDHNYPKC